MLNQNFILLYLISIICIIQQQQQISARSVENFCDEFNPCKNMADCLKREDNPSRVRCVCKRGFNGNLCEIWPKQCNPEFCFNGGTCVIIRRIPRCLCPPDYKGLFCENYTMNNINNNREAESAKTEPFQPSTSIFLNRFQLQKSNESSMMSPMFPFVPHYFQPIIPSSQFIIQQRPPPPPPPLQIPLSPFNQQQQFSSQQPNYNQNYNHNQFPPHLYQLYQTGSPGQPTTTITRYDYQYNNNNNNNNPSTTADSSIANSAAMRPQQSSSFNYINEKANNNDSTSSIQKNTICDFHPCLNYGQCLPITDTNSVYKFRCICPEFYSGILCENNFHTQSQLLLPQINHQSGYLLNKLQEYNNHNYQNGFDTYNIFAFTSRQTTNSRLPPQKTTATTPSTSTTTKPIPTTASTKQQQRPTMLAAKLGAGKSTSSPTTKTTTTTTTTATSNRSSRTTNKEIISTTDLIKSSSSTPRLAENFYESASSPFYRYSTLMSPFITEKKIRKYSLCSQLRPCANNGQCIDNDKGGDNVQKFKCICRPEFTGVFCHIKIRTRSNVCAYNLCLNSGECVPSRDNNSFSCSCPPNYTGKFCELNLYK